MMVYIAIIHKEEPEMLLKMSDFFKNLPDKICRDCGKALNEQHECYGNTCAHCLEKKI